MLIDIQYKKHVYCDINNTRVGGVSVEILYAIEIKL